MFVISDLVFRTRRTNAWPKKPASLVRLSPFSAINLLAPHPAPRIGTKCDVKLLGRQVRWFFGGSFRLTTEFQPFIRPIHLELPSNCTVFTLQRLFCPFPQTAELIARGFVCFHWPSAPGPGMNFRRRGRKTPSGRAAAARVSRGTLGIADLFGDVPRPFGRIPLFLVAFPNLAIVAGQFRICQAKVGTFFSGLPQFRRF